MSSGDPGLSSDEARARLLQDGPNELPQDRPRDVWAIAAGTVREPMFLLLAACVGIYVLVGDLRDALVLTPFVLLIVGITIFQEHRTERALAELRQLAAPVVRVRRDGNVHSIPARELVRGDVMMLNEGARVAADAQLLSATNLTVDESQLTGESVPVNKFAQPDSPTHSDRIHLGSLLVRGHGLARVTATGSNTELGRIGAALKSIDVPATQLQREIHQLVRWFSCIGVALCAAAVIGFGVTRGDWYQGAIAGISLAMSMIPEEFPAVMTIFMALTAWKMSRRQVLARRIPALEGLSSVTALCVDKTGTLTQNRMQLRALQVDGRQWDAESDEPLPEGLHALLEFAQMACPINSPDPMDQAIAGLFQRHLSSTEHAHLDWAGVREYALAPDLLATSQVWWDPRNQARVVAAKGAPEAIVDICHLPADVARSISSDVAALSARGLRVLAVANARWHAGELPHHQHDFEYQFLGLLAFEDPLRPRVVDAMRDCQAAGVRVIMITGDHPGTAAAVARQVGIASPDDVLTGDAFAALGNTERGIRLAQCHVFARVTPVQKLQLVQELAAAGEIVAMTGDGINDAPALRAAHVGVAMGGRGTDVARQAAALIVTDDDFSSIVAALRTGRHLFDNLTKASRFIIAAHIPIAIISLLPVALGWPLLLLPVHIAFLEMLIDPTCSVAFAAEPEESDLMRRPPRPTTSRLVGGLSALIGLAQGLLVAAAVTLVILLARHQGHDDNTVRSLGFMALIASNVALIFANRMLNAGPRAALLVRNRSLWTVVGVALFLLTLTLSVPSLRSLFQFAPIPVGALWQTLGITAACAILLMAVTRRPRWM